MERRWDKQGGDWNRTSNAGDELSMRTKYFTVSLSSAAAIMNMCTK